MKRACLPLALVALGALLAWSPAGAQSCSIGGHNETSENFAPGGWATTNMTPGTVTGAPSGTHLLISEVAPRGAGTGAGSDSSEYIEIYNPTSKPVSLDNKYISDDPGYYKIVNGPYLVANATKFALRFPPGLSLSPGRTLVLCVTKSGFAGSGASAAGAQYFLEMKDSNGIGADDMIVIGTGSSFPITGGMLTNPSTTNGEWVVLYCWDGNQDLVCDIDYASWGANSGSNPKMDKTGVSIDGPDAGAVPSAYNNDTPAASQTNLGSSTALTKPNTYQRVAGAGEVGEITVGGNGCLGRAVPTAIDWLPIAGTSNIRFHVRWQNPDDDNMSSQLNGNLRSQEFGVFLPDYGDLGGFSVPPLQPSSFFDVFIDIPLTQLPPKPDKILPGGGPGGVAASIHGGGPTITANCPPDTNWAGNVDLIWSGPGQTGQALKHYGDLLVCPGAGPSYIHMKSSNCPNPMPWTVTGLCPGFTATLVNDDLTPTPNPAPPGWTGFICVSSPAGTPIPTSCCFKVVFTCNGSPGTVDLCVTTCDWSNHSNPVLTDVDWTVSGGIVHFHQHWTNPSGTQSSNPVSGNEFSQPFGAFLPNSGPIGPFSVPPMAPSSFFDVFIDVPLSQLPPNPTLEMPGGGPPPGSPCQPPEHWHGNVDIIWNAAGTPGEVHKHFGAMPICPGAGPTYLWVEVGCNSALGGASWSISGVCPGYSATLVNPDNSPASNPLPPNWDGKICVTANASVPVGDSCCFKLNFNCAGVPGVIDVCAKTCDWAQHSNPVLTAVDWTTSGTTVRFHQRWTNPSGTLTSNPVSGDESSQRFGVFLPNFGPIGHFDVPAMAPSSFFDVFIDIPLSQLPPEPQLRMPGGGPPPGTPCEPTIHWHGNVDIIWSGAGTAGEVHKHFGDMPICPGAGPTYLFVETGCNSTSGTGATWSIAGLCTGFTATLVNTDSTAAPNPLPANWIGMICVSAPASVPSGTTCCFTVNFSCDGVPGVIDVCAKTCNWAPKKPTLAVIDWKRIGSTVRFHQRWTNPGSAPSDPVSGDVHSQQFGAFLPDVGNIGHFDVPPIPPSSFFDVFLDFPLSSLPPQPEKRLPGGGPAPGSPCPTDTSWSGNVDIMWSGSGGSGQVNKHFTGLLVKPGFGSSHIHTLIFCNAPPGATWSISGLCPGFTATLLNENFTPAPNPVPPGWTGWISVAAAGSVPSGTTCCFSVTFICDGVPGVIDVCAQTCVWQNAGVPPNTEGVDFGIYSAVPNPTSAGMVIGYALPKSGFAKIEVYNLGGQRVRLLVDGPAEAGSSSVRWDGRGEQGRFLPPGAYFIKLRAEDRIASKKVVLFH